MGCAAEFIPFGQRISMMLCAPPKAVRSAATTIVKAFSWNA